MSCLHIWDQDLSNLCITTFLLQDLLDAFQRGKVVGTTFEIENFDLYLSMLFPFSASALAISLSTGQGS